MFIKCNEEDNVAIFVLGQQTSGVTMRAADPGSAVAADDAVTAPKELHDRFN